VTPSPVGRVPLLGSDVHDLTGLGQVADALFATGAGGGAADAAGAAGAPIG